MKQISLALFLCFCFHTRGFTLTSELFSSCVQANSYCRTHRSDAPPLHRQYLQAADDDEDTDASASDDVAISVIIDTNLSESNTQKLFAWIKCAFDYDESDKNDVYEYYYNNIELAIAAAFGSNLPENSLPSKLMQMAMKKEGLLDDVIDEFGEKFTTETIAINIRSQISSIQKNFDTLYERTTSEAINLHDRCPKMCLGEVYMIAVPEYDDKEIKKTLTLANKITDSNAAFFDSANNFLPLAIASSILPTRLKAASGKPSTSPFIIILKPRIVSSIGTKTPFKPVNCSATWKG